MKRKIETFLEEEEINTIEELVKELKKKGFNASRSEWIRLAVVEKLNKEVKE